MDRKVATRNLLRGLYRTSQRHRNAARDPERKRSTKESDQRADAEDHRPPAVVPIFCFIAFLAD
jgi:hypothetical protein